MKVFIVQCTTSLKTVPAKDGLYCTVKTLKGVEKYGLIREMVVV